MEKKKVSRKRKTGLFFMIAGAVLVAAAWSLFFVNQRVADQAADFAVKTVSQIITCIDENPSLDESRDPYDPYMAEAEIDGNLYIGYLTIPDLGLELPVMSDWDYPSLRISPCRYAGSVKTDDLVIAAHNYSRHFGKISSLSNGACVYFTDMDGQTFEYYVAGVEVLEPADVEEMTSGEYELTLFTCTYGGRSRVTVRCAASE